MQSKRDSAIESITNTASGFAVSFLLAYYVLPLWGFEQTAAASAQVVSIFTVASVIRNYAVRRIFNARR